ncbi:type II toxin-antitoxin system HigB family toxin [Salmonella enterica]|nr:type II toxin-antitoxin system HigB family toxin [Salmonella enterica]
MHVVSRAPFEEAARRYPNDAVALDDTYRIMKKISARTPDDLRKYFGSLDRMKYRDKWWVIDIGGNNLRIMFFADYGRGKIFVKHITTHAEYDRLTKYYREHKE